MLVCEKFVFCNYFMGEIFSKINPNSEFIFLTILKHIKIDSITL